MRAAIAFVCGAMFHFCAMAANNCPTGMGTLPAGVATVGESPCISSKMVAFLICAHQFGDGRIEISSEASKSSSEGLEVSGSAGGGNLAVKLNVGGAYKLNNATTDIQKASQKLESGLGKLCRDMALAPEEPPRAPPWTPTTKGGTGGSGSLRFKGPMGPLEPGISYNQGDIYDSTAMTAAECSKLCYNDDRCIAVTWIDTQKRCWVKSFFTGNIGHSSDMTSARKLITR